MDGASLIGVACMRTRRVEAKPHVSRVVAKSQSTYVDVSMSSPPLPSLSASERAARAARIELLRQALAQRILVLDGAMGTMLQSKNLLAADFGGADHEGCNENLVLTRPELIEG